MRDYKKALKFKSKICVRMLRIINTMPDTKTSENLLQIQYSFLRLANKDIEEQKELITIVNKVTRQTKFNFVPLCIN